MKKSRIIFYALLAMLTFTACTSEVDDVFDKSSADRISEAIATDKQMLVDAPNGWLMEYFCEETYGGYNMFVKFNADNTVTVANEVYGASARATSHYKLEQSKGVLLSFDEYNNLFHFFSDPANPLGIGTNGKGMLGDFEFRVISAEADRFELQGKKHGAKVVMTRVAEDVDWDEYINDVLAMEENVSYGKYEVNVDGAEPLQLSVNYRTFTYYDAESDKDVTVPYIVTPAGLKLSKSIEYGGKTINMLTFNADEDESWSSEGVTVLPVLPSLVEQLTDVNAFWSFAKGEMSSTSALYFGKAEEGSAAEGEDIMFMALGVNPNSANIGWGFFFRSGNYIGVISMNVTVIDETHVTFVPKSYDSNGQWYYQNAGYNYIANGILRGDFELSTDNPKKPSYIRMTRTDGSLAGEYMDVFPGLQYYDN